jgi:hypothetical protein
VLEFLTDLEQERGLPRNTVNAYLLEPVIQSRRGQTEDLQQILKTNAIGQPDPAAASRIRSRSSRAVRSPDDMCKRIVKL